MAKSRLFILLLSILLFITGYNKAQIVIKGRILTHAGQHEFGPKADVLIRKQFNKAIEAFDQIVQKTREIIRPGRNVPRHKIPKRNYPMNYKRL